LLYTSAFRHQQQIELPSPEILKVTHKDQDQPETILTNEEMSSSCFVFFLI
jgi:hypothetical protein